MPTTNAVPSSAAEDLLFNAAQIDAAVNGADAEYVDRLGVRRLTLSGAMARIATINPRGPWATGTTYQLRDLALQSGSWWICIDPHIASAAFATDQASKWRIYQGSDSDAVTFTQAGSGTTDRSVQAKLRDLPISVVDKGAVSSVDAAAATTSAAASASEVFFPAGAWPMATTPTLTGVKFLRAAPGAIFSGAGASSIALSTTGGEQLIQWGSTPDQFATKYIRKQINHVGGTVGYTPATLRVDTFVSSGATDFNWGIISMLDNSATAGENTAGYLQGIKRSGAGPTWGNTVEIIDHNTNPTNGAVGEELSFTANGGDSSGARVAYDVALRKRDTGGASPTLGWGYRIQTEAGSQVVRGFSLYTGASVQIGFDTSLGTVTSAAYKMAESQAIVFNAASTRKLFHNGGGWLFSDAANAAIWQLADNGSIVNGSTQILGTRRTGWAADTGTDLRTGRASYSGTASAGYVQAEMQAVMDEVKFLTQFRKALKADLTLHGLIGT